MYIDIKEQLIKTVKEIKARGFVKILVQIPDGLKRDALELLKIFDENDIEAHLWVENTYGACDMPIHRAKAYGYDAIVHIGHTDFGVKTDLPLFYVEFYYDLDPTEILEKNLSKLEKYKNIGLVASLQFLKSLDKAKTYLEGVGKKVFVGKASNMYAGQILGCNVMAGLEVERKVDCFICIGAGKFYGLGLALMTDKPVFNLDFDKKSLEILDKTKYERMIAWNLAKFEEVKKVGVVISTKPGQYFDVQTIKKFLESFGKEVFVLIGDEITPEKIEGMGIEFLVNTACPRIGWDDMERYPIPIINYTDLVKHLKNKA